MIQNETSQPDLLTSRQHKAIDALLREPTIQAAADATGTSRATIFRWLSDATFSTVYRAARGRLLESTLTALQSASADAVVCLREILNDKTAQVSARVSAARSVLELGLKARETLETQERLAYLEKALELKKRRSP